MTARRTFQYIAFLTISIGFSLPRIASAQDAATTEIENSKYQAEGRINANAVYVRSGPSDSDYATMKLDRGAAVRVVGASLGWLKIFPPDDSYCLVAKGSVERRGDGSTGRVTIALNVRVGSSLVVMKSKIAKKLDIGADVKILGEQEEYFKIVPPKDVYLYINKQYVDLVQVVKAADTAAPRTADTGTSRQPFDPLTRAQSTGAGALDAVANSSGVLPQPGSTAPMDSGVIPTTRPGADVTALAVAPASQPAEAELEAERQFDALEQKFIENDKKPLDLQPVAELRSGYEKLVGNANLQESLRRMSEYRLSILKQRIEDQKNYLAVKKSQEEMKQKQLAMQAERDELEQRIKASGVKYFTAVGTLRLSSLQQGSATLYRLTDPKSGRTVLYVRSDDPKLGALVGQFIGLKGDVQQDQALNLKQITPTAYEVVDPAKVNTSVVSQIVPPSLLPIGGQASTGNE